LYPLPCSSYSVPLPFLHRCSTAWPGHRVQDLGMQPLLVGVAKRASHWMMQLPHKLFRSGNVTDSDGPASLGGGASTSGAVREGVDEAGDMVVLGTSGPWGRPRGLTVILIIQRINDPWTRPETTKIHHGSSSFPSSSPLWPRDEDPTIGATRLGHEPQLWMTVMTSQ
jgi:hypothetical protein